MEDLTQNEEVFDPKKSPMREAYSLLNATTPLELSLSYTVEDQKLFNDSHLWDYNNDEQIPNKIRKILEESGEDGLTEDEKEWKSEILWFWYHHAISCANWKNDTEKRKEYSAKALSYQGNNPNILTRTMFYLSHGKIDEAEKWTESNKGNFDYETSLEIIDGYKKNGFW